MSSPNKNNTSAPFKQLKDAKPLRRRASSIKLGSNACDKSLDFMDDYTQTIKKDARPFDDPELVMKHITKIRDTLIRRERDAKRVVLQGVFDTKVTHEVDENTREELTNFVKAMKNINVKLDVQNPIDETMKQAKKAIPELEQHLKAGVEESLQFIVDTGLSITALLVIIYAAYKIRNGGSKWWYAAGIYCGLILTNIAGKHGAFGEQIRQAFLEQEEAMREKFRNVPGYRPAPDYARSAKFKPATPQFGEGAVSGILKPVLCFLSVYTTGKTPPDRKIDTFLNRASKMPAAKDGIEAMVSWGFDTIKSMINFVRVHVLGQSMLSWADEAAPDVTEWCADVVELTHGIHMGEVEVNIENNDHIQELILKGTHFGVKYFRAKEHAKIRDVINQHIVLLRKYQAKFERGNLRGESIRKEALGIVLRGPTGAGKTMITIPLALSLAKRVMDPAKFARLSRNTNELFYQRHVEDEYWDGYFGQFISIFDDSGQIRDCVGNQTTTREWMDIIRFFGVAKHVLHMADLANKGVVECRSEIGIVTSNLRDFSHIQSIIQPEAVERRFHIIADVVPRKEFCRPDTREKNDIWDRRLDRDDEWLRARGCAKEVYEFWICDTVNKGYHCKLDYDEFVDYCVKIKKDLDAQHAKYANAIRCEVEGTSKPASYYMEAYEATRRAKDNGEQVFFDAQDDFDPFAEAAKLVTQGADPSKGKYHRDPTEVEKELLREINAAEHNFPEPVGVSEADKLSKKYSRLQDLLDEADGTMRGFDYTAEQKSWFDVRHWNIMEKIDYEALMYAIRDEIGDDMFRELLQDPNGFRRLGPVFRATGRMVHVLRKARSKMFHNPEELGYLRRAYESIKSFFCSVYRKVLDYIKSHPKLSVFLALLGVLSMGVAALKMFKPDRLTQLTQDAKDMVEHAELKARHGVKRVWKWLFPDSDFSVQGSDFYVMHNKVIRKIEPMSPEGDDLELRIEPNDVLLVDGVVVDLARVTNPEFAVNAKLEIRPNDDKLTFYDFTIAGKTYKGKSFGVMRANTFETFTLPQTIETHSPFSLEFDGDPYIDCTKVYTGDVATATNTVYITQSASGTKGKGQQQTKQQRFKAHNMKQPEKVILQGAFDPNAKELLFATAKNNQYTINLPGRERKYGIVTFVCGQIAMFPYHFVRYFENEIANNDDLSRDTVISLKNVIANRELKVPLSYLLDAKTNDQFRSRDVCFTHMPTVIMHGDLTKKFASTRFWDTPHDQHMLLATLDNDLPVLYETEYLPLPEYVIQEDEEDDETQFKVVSVAVAYASTMAGDCGGIGCVNNAAVGPGKLFYMHIAGSKNDNRAVGAMLTREDITAGVAMFTPKASINTPQCLEHLPVELKSASFGPCPIAKLPPGRGVYSPNKSKIIPSALHNFIKTSTVTPAKLGRFVEAGILYDPLQIAHKKYTKPGAHCDEAVMQQCIRHLMSTMFNASKVNVKPEVYPFEEAVCGRVGNKFFSAINRGSGAGWDIEFPHLKSRGKTAFFGTDEQYSLDSEECIKLKRLVLRDIADARRGIRHLHVYSDYLKDETRPIQKVYQGKTRMISGAPLRLVVATRMLFLAFSIWLMENCILNGCAVGINVYSDQWDMLVRILKSMGNHNVAGDFIGHDASMFYSLLMGSLPFINEFYNDGPENAMARYIYFLEVVSSFHASGDTLYQFMSKLPSGHPLTVILNCIAVLLLFRIAFLLIVGSLAKFNELVAIVVYGDDNVLSIHHTIINTFNQHTIAKVLDTVGFQYTAEDKTSTVAATRPLSDVTFLKRGFRFEEKLHKYVAPLDLDTILEIPMWTKKGAASHTIACDNVDNALHELALHDQATFDLWAGKIVRASEERLCYYPPVVDRMSLLREVRERTEFW
jgi:hypothetical protein